MKTLNGLNEKRARQTQPLQGKSHSNMCACVKEASRSIQSHTQLYKQAWSGLQLWRQEMQSQSEETTMFTLFTAPTPSDTVDSAASNKLASLCHVDETTWPSSCNAMRVVLRLRYQVAGCNRLCTTEESTERCRVNPWFNLGFPSAGEQLIRKTFTLFLHTILFFLYYLICLIFSFKCCCCSWW